MAAGRSWRRDQGWRWRVGVEDDVVSYYKKKSADILIIINGSTKNTKRNKITNRSLYHLAKTTSTRVSKRCAAVLAPPSPELGKACLGRACCSILTGSCRAKASKGQCSRGETIANDENRRSEEKSNTLTLLLQNIGFESKV
jgi:hypothetical protein